MSNEDKNTSDLRRLLQEKLAQSEAAGDGWNVPSGKVWSGVSEELTASKQVLKDTRRSLWPWVAIGLLVVALIVRECTHIQAVGRMEEEMMKIQQDCEEKQSKRNDNRSNDNSEIAALAMGAAPIVFHEAPQQAATPNKPYNSSLNNFGSPQNLQAQPNLFSDETNIEQLLTSGTMEEIRDNQPQLQSAQLMNAPSLLQNPRLSFLANRNEQPHLPNNLGIPVLRKKGLGLVASLHAGLALTGNHLTGEKPNIISDQKALFSWQSGVGLEAVINRNWSVLTGLNYNISRIETDYSLAVPFTHNGEFQHDDGNYDNQYNHSLPSSLGEYPLQMVLSRASDATIHEGEVMDIDLRIRQKTQLFSLPLQLRYGFGKNNWQMGIRAGGIANHILDVESETPDLNPLHSAIHQRKTFVGAPAVTDLEKWTFDYAIGLDMRYRISSRIALSMSTGYQRGFTPVYQDDAVKNYFQAVNLGVGFHYWLR